jgi:hypothetical protein
LDWLKVLVYSDVQCTDDVEEILQTHLCSCVFDALLCMSKFPSRA